MVWADELLVHPAVRLPVHQADQVGVHHRQQEAAREAAPVQLQQLLLQAAQQPRLLLPGQLLLAARVRVGLPVEVGLPVLVAVQPQVPQPDHQVLLLQPRLQAELEPRRPLAARAAQRAAWQECPGRTAPTWARHRSNPR